MAQADMHHAVVSTKAKDAKMVNVMTQMMTGSKTRLSSNTVWQVARRYNGRGSRARKYADSISSCYNCMAGIANKQGRVTNGNRLKGCLDKATH